MTTPAPCPGCGQLDPMGDEDAWHSEGCPVVAATTSAQEQARAAEEFRTLRRSFNESDRVNRAWLTFLVWHAGNLVSTATNGRYRLALMHGGTEVEPITLKGDDAIEAFHADT